MGEKNRIGITKSRFYSMAQSIESNIHELKEIVLKWALEQNAPSQIYHACFEILEQLIK